MRLLRLNKPFRVLSQFTDPGGRPTLADFVDIPHVYPAGRLDFDSEGLMLLTSDGALQASISEPRYTLPKTYLVQVEGKPEAADLDRLLSGVTVKGQRYFADRARMTDPPAYLWSRDPPVRVRKSIPTSWLEIVLTQGRNRQVRRMTATIGYPTLRLVRTGIGKWTVADLAPGEWQVIPEAEIDF